MKKHHLGQESDRDTERSIKVSVGELVQEWWDRAFDTEMIINDWPGFVISNQQRFWDTAQQSYPDSWRVVGRKISRHKSAPIVSRPAILEFTHVDLSWSPSVGNTSSYPHIDVMNWKGTPGHLRCYPGWTGSMEWQVAWPREHDGLYLGSDLFSNSRQTRVHTGCGGGGKMHNSQRHGCTVQTFAYEVRIYAADWTGMARTELSRQMQEVLAGDRYGIDAALLELMQSTQMAELATTTRSTWND
jgi:hypothetical protein